MRQIILSRDHAVRVRGTAAFQPRPTMIASSGTRQWIEERGRADDDTEFDRVLQLCKDHHEILSLTRLDLVDELTVTRGSFDVKQMHIGRGHSRKANGRAPLHRQGGAIID